MAVVALSEGEGEVGGVVGELAQDFRVVLEDHHLEVEDGDEDGDGCVEQLRHGLQLTSDILPHEVHLFLLAEAAGILAGNAVLLLETGQDDVLLLLLHLRNDLTKTFQV